MTLSKFLKVSMYAISLALSLGLTTAVLMPSAAYAESKIAEVYTKFTDDELFQILKKRYPNTTIQSSGRIIIDVVDEIWRKKRSRILIDNSSYDSGCIEMVSFWNDIDWSLEQVNDWNGRIRFVRLSSSDGRKVMTAYIPTKGGVTEDTILEYVRNMSFMPLMVEELEGKNKNKVHTR